MDKNCDVEEIADLSTLDLKKIKWYYVGEGDCHVVVALPDKKLVMRFSKYDDLTYQKKSDEESKYRRLFLFHYYIISPLLNFMYGSIPIIGEISSETVSVLNEGINNQRPHMWRGKSIKYGYVEIYPDYSLMPQDSLYKQPCIREVSLEMYKSYRNKVLSMLHVCSNRECELKPTFSIELKPKSGWIPLRDRLYPKCTFCMNQYVKMTNKRYIVSSEYCPLDLFSGDESRIKHALKCMLLAPQNNVKIFKNGHLVYGEGIKSEFVHVLKDWFNACDSNCEELVDIFCDLIYKALVSDISSDEKGISNDEKGFEVETEPYQSCVTYFKSENVQKISDILLSHHTVCNWDSKPMSENCVLNKILNIQKLDKEGFENVYEYYKRYVNEEHDEYIERLVPCRHNNARLPKLNIAECYILSTIAKDCSIFISTQYADHAECKEVLQDLLGHKYNFSIAVVDIGPKPFKCILKHKKRNSNILNSALQHFGLHS